MILLANTINLKKSLLRGTASYMEELVSDKLVVMDIVQLLKFSDKFAGIEVHLPVGGKNVKLNYASDQFVAILRKLQQKDVSEVYIKQDDCKKILELAQESLSSKNFYDPETINEKRVESVNAAMAVVKTMINQLGVDVETVKLLKTINTRAMALLSEAPSLFTFVKRYKKNCAEEFLLSILTNYIMSRVIDKFPWASDQVKEKGALASLICDMYLTKEQFNEIREWERNGGELSEEIIKHPLKVSENLKKNRHLIPMETITIIEQHHELPDGTGYPHGITANRFNQLSSIFIISQQFTELLHLSDYNFDKRDEIIKTLREKYSISKTFDRSLDALVSVIG